MQCSGAQNIGIATWRAVIRLVFLNNGKRLKMPQLYPIPAVTDGTWDLIKLNGH